MKAHKAPGGMAEKYAIENLEKKGYVCEKPIRTRWQREDFFGLWDIIAIKKNEIKFVQVSLKPYYDRGIEYKKRVADFPKGKAWSCEFWQYKEGGWRVWQL